MPGNFPKWRTVRPYFQRGIGSRENSISLLEEALKNQVAAARLKQGGNEKTALLIVDAQSVKNTDAAGEKGYDAGKKVSGIERHIAVDTQGFLHAVVVMTTDVTDRKGCLAVLERSRDKLGAVKGPCRWRPRCVCGLAR